MRRPWDRDEVTPTEAADLALHAALLVGAVDAGAAEERVESVVAAQRGEPFGLGAVTPLGGRTRITAGVRLSYRIRPGTPPKYSKASTWPSRKASWAWVANAT